MPRTRLDLNRLMIRNPDSTYVVRVIAHEMTGDRINYGDMLVVDRSLRATGGSLVICQIEGDYALRMIRRDTRSGCLWLHSLISGEPPTQVTQEIGLYVWGVVTWQIKYF